MIVLQGTAASLWRLGDPYRFVAALEDCGDGFDWRAADPALRFWIEDPLCEELVDGAWRPLENLVVHRQSGRVGFSRCLRGSVMRAHGLCLPATLEAEAAQWELQARIDLHPRSDLGRTHEVHTTTAQRSIVRIAAAVQGPLLARLPFQGGVFVGIGDSSPNGSGSVLTMSEEGVAYVPC